MIAIGNIFIILDLYSALVIFLLGYYVFLKDSKRDVNKLFFIFTLALTVIAISSVGLRIIGHEPGTAPEKVFEAIPKERIHLLLFWNQTAWIGTAFVASILLHLTLTIVKKKKLLKEKRYYIFLFYFLSLLFFLWTLPFYYEPWGSESLLSRLFYILFTIYFIATCFISLFLLIKEYFTLKSPKEKIKIRYFIIGFLIPFLGTSILDVFIPLVKFHEFVGVTYSLYFVTLGYIFIAIGVLRYGLFIDYREILETIFKGLAELVIVTDRDGLILLTNEITLKKFNFKEEEIKGKRIQDLLKGKGKKWKELKERIKKEGRVIEDRVYFLTKEKEETPFLLTLSLKQKKV